MNFEILIGFRGGNWLKISVLLSNISQSNQIYVKESKKKIAVSHRQMLNIFVLFGKTTLNHQTISPQNGRYQ